MKTLSKPAKHAKSSFHDLKAISILENILASHELVMPDLKRQSTWSNIDGYLELLDQEGHPIGKLEAQVKSKISIGEKKKNGSISYTFNNNKFLAYCSRIKGLAILFILIDRKNEIGYWIEVTPNIVRNLKNKTICLPAKNKIAKDNPSYYQYWLKISQKRDKIIEEGEREREKMAYKKGVVAGKIKKKKEPSKIKEISDKFQQALISRELKIKYYYGFINFLEPFYKDKRGEIKREKLRRLFRITKKDEICFIDELEKNNLIEVTGNLVTVKDKDKAKENLNELIEKPVISVAKIINLFSD